MQFHPPFERHPAWLRLILLGVIIVASLFLLSMLGLLIATAIFGPGVTENLSSLNQLSDPAAVRQLKFFQIISQLGLFIIPAILFTLLSSSNRTAYLQMGKPVPALHLLAAPAIMLLGLPLINLLLEWNMALSLPDSMAGLEQWMRASEDQAARVTEAFLLSAETGDLIVNILMIAILPALGEELIFRGLLQRLLHEWIKNIHIAIIISAMVFSFIHFQFYGFLPRFLMGMLFGYLLYWSGSLWVPILAHLVNNGTAVIVAWVSVKYFPEMDFNTFGRSDQLWVNLCSAAAVILVLLVCWLRRRRQPPAGLSVQ